MVFFVQDSVNGICLHTDEFIPAGKIIKRFNKKEVSKKRTYQSIQMGKNVHIQNEFASTLNHSCDPVTIIDTKNYVVIANRDIHRGGEEINFFYPSTEWKMAQPFHCKCGAENCLKYVAGAYQLPARYMQLYFINDHIKELMILVNIMFKIKLASRQDLSHLSLKNFSREDYNDDGIIDVKENCNAQ